MLAWLMDGLETRR